MKRIHLEMNKDRLTVCVLLHVSTLNTYRYSVQG